MTLEEFIAYWSAHAHDESATERASAQSHFIGLCQALGLEPPRGPDYTFEKAVRKVGGGQGFADVWKRGHFAWEYKRAGSNLRRAYEQLTLYRDDLENPPLLIVSDLLRFEVHTNFNGTNPRVYAFTLEELRDPANQQLLRWAFTDPERLNPKHQRRQITEEATERVGAIARALVGRGHDPAQVAHFMMQLVFSLFAEDVGLLPKGIMTALLERGKADPLRLQRALSGLFATMSTGGDFGIEEIRHFNGGLFDGTPALPLEPPEIAALHEASVLDWADVEPHIFGTLFERSLDPNKRGQLGAHYTSREDILRIVEPVVLRPLREEWKALREAIQAYLEANPGPRPAVGKGKGNGKTKTKAQTQYIQHVSEPIERFLRKLQTLKVLDPACGSGNFLYITMQGLLDIQRDVLSFAAEIGEPPLRQFVSPEQFYGIELNPFAHELASMVVWIGYLQWKRANGESNHDNPVLRKLDTIQLRDALLNPDGTEAQWPEADYVVGNPPFLGDKKMRSELGNDYVDTLRRVYQERVPGQADLVCYWFEKARAQIEAGKAKRAGLIATNSIRHGKNRAVLERIKQSGDIFLAWPNENWVLDGADVRVSIVGFDDGSQALRLHNGLPVREILTNLRVGVDTTRARPLRANRGWSFMGVTPAGPFEVPGTLARAWLKQPQPPGVCYADVLRPFLNGDDLTGSPRDVWLIDFFDRSTGQAMDEAQASRYLVPFAYVRQGWAEIKELQEEAERTKKKVRLPARREKWWQHERTRPELRRALRGLQRYLMTSRVATHRLFVWADVDTLPDSTVVAVASNDDFMFGTLNSTLHRVWAEATGSDLGVGDDPRYTNTTCFETFPFPECGEAAREEVRQWARHVEQLRQSLLRNPAVHTPTLTSLYNAVEHARTARDTAAPTYALVLAQDRLDQAVAAAYGWEWPLSDEQILERLLKLNLERAAAEGLAEPEREPA